MDLAEVIRLKTLQFVLSVT